MRKVLTAAAFLCLAALLPAMQAQAKTFAIPSEDPVATITIPDSWGPSTTDDGVEATSADKGIYVAAEGVDATDLTSAIAEGIKYLVEQGITLDQASQNKRELKINGMDAIRLSFTGKDADGPTNVSLTIVITSPDKFVMLTYWGSEAGANANGADLQSIIESLQTTKK